MKKIFIAGASGYIGHALVERLLKETPHQIVAASRSDRESHDPRLTWKKCDLFSLRELMEASQGCDTAYYLVHSMLPSAALTQGEFYDFDLLIADNFARAAKQNNLQHVIYLSGIIPDSDDVSWHLKSRLEVEETLRASGIRITTLRASLVIGPHGSSFTILKKLVERLPMMIVPAWLETKFQPIDLQDCINILIRAHEDESIQGKTYDIGSEEVLTYKDMIQRSSDILKLNRRIFVWKWIPLKLSRSWVAFISQTPANLVYPLVLSLRYPMLVHAEMKWPIANDIQTPVETSLKRALEAPEPKEKSKRYVPEQGFVRSVQRLPLPGKHSAEWATRRYFDFLPSLFFFLIRAEVTHHEASFYFLNPKWKLLRLEKSEDRSSKDRQLLYVKKGWLSQDFPKARLEFREVLGRKFLLAAIHDFYPSLPWFLYRYTQAIVHLWVMKRFCHYLRRHV